ncbi:hypothetical protein ABFU14_05150 [Xanthomonas campestris pv. raphani]|uniref:hypothetical protein n=1 Tax=Xanthomonas campestris TaxID=339 RepID=UPI00388E96E6
MQTKTITLTRVGHFLQGAKPHPLGTLSQRDVDVLSQAFTDQGKSAKVGSRAHTILDELIKTDCWLLCSCKSNDPGHSPVLFVSRKNSALRPLTLVRNHARGLHDEACGFHRLPGANLGHSLAERVAVAALGVLKSTDGPTVSGTTHKSSTGTSKSTSTPKLARVLFTLLERAGLNRVVASPRSISGDASKLMRAASGLCMDKEQAIPATDFIGHNFYRLNQIAKKVEKASNWPKSLSPHGFVIGLCERQRDASGAMYLVDPFSRDSPPQNWNVNGRVRLPGPGTIGPYVAIGLVAKVAGKQTAEIVQAYVHPAYDFGSLLLVDSDLERQTLALIAERQAEMKQRKNPYSIIKPYVDLTEPKSKISYRPDFVINSRGREMAVETMGYVDEEYLARKSRMHKVMRKCYVNVIEHRPGINDDDVREQIERFVGFSST